MQLLASICMVSPQEYNIILLHAHQHSDYRLPVPFLGAIAATLMLLYPVS